jgi:predicted transcriptional regulator
MTSEVLDRPRLTMREVAKRAGVDVTTAWRWVLRGVRGQQLRSVSVGGRRFVMIEDLDGFLRALNRERVA